MRGIQLHYFWITNIHIQRPRTYLSCYRGRVLKLEERNRRRSRYTHWNQWKSFCKSLCTHLCCRGLMEACWSPVKVQATSCNRRPLCTSGQSIVHHFDFSFLHHKLFYSVKRCLVEDTGNPEALGHRAHITAADKLSEWSRRTRSSVIVWTELIYIALHSKFGDLIRQL